MKGSDHPCHADILLRLVNDRDVWENNADAPNEALAAIRPPAALPEQPAFIYEVFISMLEQNAPAQAFIGGCHFYASLMAGTFPELRAVWGWVACEQADRWPHWFVMSASGLVFDPTRSQFKEVRGYGEWPTDEPVPVGYCNLCNGLVPPSYVCACGADYRRTWEKAPPKPLGISISSNRTKP